MSILKIGQLIRSERQKINMRQDELAEKNQYKLATTFNQKAFDYHLKHRKVQHWEELT